MKNKIFIPFILLLVTMVVASCSDDDGLNSKELKVYVRAGETLPIETMVTHTPVGSFGEVQMNIPLRATRPVLADATVVFGASEALLDKYNADHKTVYDLLPETSYTLSDNGRLTLLTGEMQSSTGLSIEIPDLSVLTSKKGYLLPICMESVDSRDKGVEASTNLNTIYLIVHTRSQSIDDTATSIEGTMYDRSGWTMMFEGTDTNLADIFDGNAATGWISGWSDTPTPVIIDMQESRDFTGIRIGCQYKWGNAMCQKDYEVFVSDDGEQWSSEGTVELPRAGGDQNNPEYQYVKFYGTMTARYIKLQFANKYSYYYSFSEIDVYQ